MQVIIAKHKEDGVKEIRGLDKACREFGIQKGRIKNLIKSNENYKGWIFSVKEK